MSKPAVPPAVRNWLVARYLQDPTPGRWADAPDSPVVFERLEPLTDVILKCGADVLATLNECKAAGWVDDVSVDLLLADAPPPVPRGIARLGLPLGRHRLIGIRPAVLTPATSARLNDAPNSLSRRAATDPKARLKLAVYDRIRQQPGKPADRLSALKADKQFVGMVKDAGLVLNAKLVRAARRGPDRKPKR